jgi:hypothetical protein
VGVGREGNVEHEQSNFLWGLDNWIYSTYNAFCFRWTPHRILRDPTALNGASWGLTPDDDGKMWFINAGAKRGPVNFQFPIQYGSLTLEDGFEPGFDTEWPAPGIGDNAGRHATISFQPARLIRCLIVSTAIGMTETKTIPSANSEKLFLTMGTLPKPYPASVQSPTQNTPPTTLYIAKVA